MKTLLHVVLAGAALLGAHAAMAEDAPVPPEHKEPVVQRTVTEDDLVRIEEVKVRGQMQSITVKSKLRGIGSYEIVPSSGARDPSQPGNPAGQRVWNFLSF